MASERLGIGVDDLAWIQRDQFVHYLTVTRTDHDAGDWSTFRPAVLEALTAAFGLDEEPTNDQTMSVALDVVDGARRAFDPATCWPAFIARLWARRHIIRPDLS